MFVLRSDNFTYSLFHLLTHSFTGSLHAERVDMDLGAPDSVDRVVSMIESLADKDKLDQSFDEGEDSDDDDEESEYIGECA